MELPAETTSIVFKLEAGRILAGMFYNGHFTTPRGSARFNVEHFAPHEVKNWIYAEDAFGVLESDLYSDYMK